MDWVPMQSLSVAVVYEVVECASCCRAEMGPAYWALGALDIHNERVAVGTNNTVNMAMAAVHSLGACCDRVASDAQNQFLETLLVFGGPGRYLLHHESQCDLWERTVMRQLGAFDNRMFCASKSLVRN